ncbi:renal dipeptidase [Halenospora varia]|nr:renal dipeptidase [Halenospora varia]
MPSDRKDSFLAQQDLGDSGDSQRQEVQDSFIKSLDFWKVILGLVVAAGVIFSHAFGFKVSIIGCKNNSDLVNSILSSVPLTDGHNDFPIWLRAFYENHIYKFNDTSSIDGQVDFPRLVEGRIRAQFWSVYVPCPENESKADLNEVVHDTLQQIDLHLSHAVSSQQAWTIFGRDPKQIASLMGAEGLHQIGNSASILRLYHKLGVRYITLTHDCNNIYADAALAWDELHGGLSKAGIQILGEMNRLGMIIDLSHTSFLTQRDALNVTKAPVIYSHSNAWSLCHHPRNVPDDILLLVKQNRGVVMVSFYAEYLNCGDKAAASLADVVAHIVYIGNLIGYEHVGIGSDFDGMSSGPVGLEDVSKYPVLVSELVNAGIKRKNIEGIVGRNVLRVLEEVEQIAARMKTFLPLEDKVKSFLNTTQDI